MARTPTTPLDPLQRDALISLGQRLRICRASRSDSIERMAERMQCSITTYMALEKGLPTVQIGFLVKALAILGSLDSLQQVAPISADVLNKIASGTKRVRGQNATTPDEKEIDF
ncbi:MULTISPECIES: helix-turn-helix transcriptional regulator [unclassified Iodobacter]|uniref:helix-turn-helix domain-containing protein n=1 Tax=unclassified Iodobacter TaxID=235634 RepID=UPI0025D32F9D|nr:MULTISPECIES: helix-turn-helix transcriptional regulator [unclassified Iodobacter]MDW5416327.1 helix-turn-helix transcriptional regulator [Iodobacter sp. CM08]